MSQLFLNAASQVVQFVYYTHDFGQLCVHDPKGTCGQSRVSRFALVLVPLLVFLLSPFTWSFFPLLFILLGFMGVTWITGVCLTL